ncbi:hypothetical protein BsWGS_20091 [Bradybaena similaris]
MRPYLRWLLRRRCLIKYVINRVLGKIFWDTESEARKQSDKKTNKAFVPATREEPSHDQVRHKQGVASQALQQSEDRQTGVSEFSLRCESRIEIWRVAMETSTLLQLCCPMLSTHKQNLTSSTLENETINKFEEKQYHKD